MPTNPSSVPSFTLTAPTVSAPTPPVAVDAMGPTTSCQPPLPAYAEMALSFASELRTFRDEAQSLVGRGCDLAAFAEAIESAGRWSEARAAAARWLAYTERGERLAWQKPQRVWTEVAPLMRKHVQLDPDLAVRMPALDAFAQVRSVSAKRGARTRKKHKEEAAKKPSP